MIRPLLAAALALLLAVPARADFASCVASIKSEAARQGVSGATLKAAFDGLQPDTKVLEFETSQPEFKTPIWDYLAALVDDERVTDGKAAMAANAGALAKAEERFGVSRYVIAAIWGVESNFGHDMGDRSLVQSLTTLACEGSRRPGYFRGELMATLKIADRGDIPLDKLKGSWAGAFGQTQFMPSTFLRLAVDLDGSGRDIVDSAAAALGSTANYLHKSGWRTGRALGLRSEAARGLFRAFGPQEQAADVRLGRARDHADRRQGARRGRGGPAAAGRRRWSRVPGDAQLRCHLFLQRRRILHAGGRASSRSASPAAAASSRRGRPTIPASPAPNAASCRPC